MLATALNWAKDEGWNPGIYDAEAFLASDPKGFFMGFIGDTPISAVSAVAYDRYFGFIGLYIVIPSQRGKGYGMKIWMEAVKYLGNRNVGLDGVVAQQENYKKSGFKFAWKNIRFKRKNGKLPPSGRTIVDLKKGGLEKILSYDRQFFPAHRRLFLQKWIRQPQSVSLGYLSNGRLTGYGVIRKCIQGFKIGSPVC